MRIRAVVLHLMWDDDLAVVEKFVQTAKSINPATIRVSVSPPPRDKAEEVISALQDRGVRYISATHLYYDADDVYRYAAQYGVFSSLLNVTEYIKFLKTIYEKGEIHLSRYVALMLGGAVYNSPYFPASITTRRGITISLLYPNDLQTLDDVPRVLRLGEELGRYVASTLGLEYLGVDASLSPWGEESVAKALYRLFGIRPGEPGSHHAIYKLNQAIETADVKKVGFNEVMLPLAEDEELKRLVYEGFLNLDHFVSYTSVCIPGLDMAPVKISDWTKLKHLLYDLAAVSHAKRRPVGVRIFPVDTDEYEVEGFGKTPALRLKP
jgi:uncharacterized protein (UPF0210 family)